MTKESMIYKSTISTEQDFVAKQNELLKTLPDKPSPALVKTAVASLLTHWTIGAIRALHLVLSDKQGAFPSNHPKGFTLKPLIREVAAMVAKARGNKTKRLLLPTISVVQKELENRHISIDNIRWTPGYTPFSALSRPQLAPSFLPTTLAVAVC